MPTHALNNLTSKLFNRLGWQTTLILLFSLLFGVSLIFDILLNSQQIPAGEILTDVIVWITALAGCILLIYRFTKQLQQEIAERKQVEEALRTREGFLDAIFQNLPLDSFARDKFERLIMQSAHSLQHYATGSLPEEVNVGPQTLAVWKENNRRALRGETVRDEFEYEVEGQLRQFYEIVAPMYIEEKIEGIVGFTLDITDRKQAEESLRQVFEQERRQRQIADSLREVATLLNSSLDQPTILLQILEELARVIPNDGIGIFLQENESLVLVEGIGPAAKANIQARLPLASPNPTARVFQTQRLIMIADLNTEPHWLIWPEGHLVQSWMGAPLIVGQKIIGVLTVDSFALGAFHQEDGQILQTFANQAAMAIQNARLFEALRRYERIVSATSDGISLLDRNYVYQIVNQTYLKWHSKSLDQIIGYSVSDLLGPDVFEKVVKEEFDKALAGETVHYQAWFEYPALGRRFVSVTHSPYREPDSSISGVVTSTRDLTELELMAEQVRQAQKLEAVGQLAAGVAHHFNNMLTPIIGFTSLSLLKLPPNDPIAKNLQQVETTAQQLAIMVSQLLSFARRQLIRPQDVNLNELIMNTEAKMRQLLPDTIEVNINLAPDLSPIKIDTYQFEQLLISLVINARDAMPAGGRLTLATANVTLSAGETGLADDFPPGHYTRLTINDTGIGMSEAIKSHLFEPFFTTKEVGQGTGLGLALCFGIVKQHGGHITVESQPGQGATFNIFLPPVSS
jgi:PAS domain S-box-containing protein